tara:strand:- start:1889 stop:2053 length:165 start_codon:yes stop_codon:yes gene_type:complete
MRNCLLHEFQDMVVDQHVADPEDRMAECAEEVMQYMGGLQALLIHEDIRMVKSL